MKTAIDDCWNRIGVQGDSSCGELTAHVHCRNCPVYASAARQMLDMPRPADERSAWTHRFAQPREVSQRDTRSVLIFRCAAEWFALPTALCIEIAGTRSIRTLPHRRDASVLGLTNVRGELIVCVSLSALLGLASVRGTAIPRLLIVKGKGEPTALHVDEVHGTHRYSQQEVQSVPDTLATSTLRSSHSALRWRDRTVGFLDGEALLARLDRCIA